MDNTDLPEYLKMFSNTGKYTVKVKFKTKTASIVEQHVHAQEITKLISRETGMFYKKMYFDEHLFSIEKIEINLIKKEIVIKTN
jgi:hypothetical protein